MANPSNAFADLGFGMENTTPASGYFSDGSITQGITTAAATQATAVALTANYNVVSTTTSPGAVTLPNINIPGAVVEIINLGTAIVTPYPPGSAGGTGTLVAGTINGGTTLAAGTTIAAASGGVPGIGRFVCTGQNTFVNA